MAVGDLIKRDYQYEYRGYLFGSGTPMKTEEVTGLLALPNIRDEDLERQDADGDYPGRMLSESRIIDVEGHLIGAPGADIETKIQEASYTFMPSQAEEWFVFQRPGQGKWFSKCRVRKRDIASEFATARGRAAISLMLKATDPRLYSLEEKRSQVTVVSGRSTATVTSVRNDGNYHEFPILEITGPTVNPRIKHNGQNKTLRIDITVNSGQTLVIDTKKRTVSIGSTDHYDKVRSDNQWWGWYLVPGNNSITYSRTGTNGSSTLTVRHRDVRL